MRFRISSVRTRPALAGIVLLFFASTLGIDGCVSYKLTGLYVEPSAGACVSPGATAQFTAYGLFTEGGHATKTENISDAVTWTSGIPWLVSSISSDGLVTATTQGIGDTPITATAPGEFGLVWNSAEFTVSQSCVATSDRPAVVTGLRIIPGDQNLASVGDTTKLVAVQHYSGAPWSREVSDQATWTSSDPKIATVAPGGFVTAVSAGTATITATQTTDRGLVVTTSIRVAVGGPQTNQ